MTNFNLKSEVCHTKRDGHLLFKILNLKFNRRGFTLIELILAIAIFAVIAAGVAVPIIGNHLNSLENRKNVQANTLLTEAWEAVRSIRSNDWSDIVNGAHGLRLAGGVWEFYGTSDETDRFTRVITVSDVYRDADGDRVASGGTPDPDSKQVELQISWQPTPYENRSLTAESLLTNYLNPGVWPPI